ncbi:hypothetical protein [Nocardia asteroides]|nr:hypothetical protein [Nocardia asteroides]TLF70395.1 hypothetical protein FEK33_09390 [Nocardia asteroides NBRC 15531]UGT49931.1 hypothetical protein LT345_04865 [Nocardia asteroides]SFN24984.1 hypothetical protein SAMN05444423_107235 [Nocardia asteroides]VEG37315.1 Uncharacterised protein [Nocardia asteroides]
MTMRVKSMLAGLAAGAVAMGTMVAGAGTASALPSSLVGINCMGLSPNIVDVPYSNQVIVSYLRDQSGLPSFTVHSGASIWGYQTHPTLTWTNLATGASGSLTGHTNISSIFGTGGTVYFTDVPTGTGPVRVDLSIVNTGLVPVPAVTCSGTTDIV